MLKVHSEQFNWAVLPSASIVAFKRKVFPLRVWNYRAYSALNVRRNPKTSRFPSFSQSNTLSVRLNLGCSNHNNNVNKWRRRSRKTGWEWIHRDDSKPKWRNRTEAEYVSLSFDSMISFIWPFPFISLSGWLEMLARRTAAVLETEKKNAYAPLVLITSTKWGFKASGRITSISNLWSRMLRQ